MATLITEEVGNFNGRKISTSSSFDAVVIVAVFLMELSMPPMRTQFPAGTWLTSTRYRPS